MKCFYIIYIVLFGAVHVAEGDSVPQQPSEFDKIIVSNFPPRSRKNVPANGWLQDGKFNCRLFLKLLTSHDPDLQVGALFTLGTVNLEKISNSEDWAQIRDTMWSCLKAENKEVRCTALSLGVRPFANGKDADKFAGVLFDALREKDDEIVLAALDGVPYFGRYVLASEEAIGTLRGLAFDPKRLKVRDTATRYLISLIEVRRK